MAGPGLYYPSPPVFIGGRQPYAPAQPVPPPISIAPTPALRNLVVLHQILQAWQPVAPASQHVLTLPPPAAVVVAAPPPPRLSQLYTVLQATQPGPYTVLWSAPSGSTQPPPAPLPPESISTGLLQLFTVLRAWEPAPFALVTILPKIPVPRPAPAQTPPYFNTGQLQLFIVLRSWDPAPIRQITLKPPIPPGSTPPVVSIAGRLLLLGVGS